MAGSGSNSGKGLTMQQRQELSDAFNQFADANAMLVTADIGSIVRALGMELTEDEIQAVARDADRNDAGLITLPQFLNAVGNATAETDAETNLRAAFAAFDRDRDGYIATTELHKLLTKRGACLSRAEADALIAAADTDNDGFILIDDAVELLLSK